MHLEWRGGRPLADRELVAELCAVSCRTVRRYCRPADWERVHGRALYDVHDAIGLLARVTARPARTVAAARARVRQMTPPGTPRSR